MGTSRFRGFLIAIVTSLAGVLFPNEPGFAWDFSMQAAFKNTYEYYAQQGPSGFFGTYNVDQSAGVGGLSPGDYSSLNSWVGRWVDHLTSGTDASRQYFNLHFLPQIRLNKAIRFRAKYRLGDYGNPENSDYIANTRPGTNVATSDGQWTMWWVTAQTPWGIIALGKRPMPFGTGLQYNGIGNITTEGVAVISQYGPFRFSYGFRPFFPQPPNPRSGQSTFPYYNIFDKNGVRRLANRVFVTYRAGCFDVGSSMRGSIGMPVRSRKTPRPVEMRSSRTMSSFATALRTSNIPMGWSSSIQSWHSWNGSPSGMEPDLCISNVGAI